MTIVTLQRRYMTLGKIRLGDKGAKGQPQKLTTFRLTSPSLPLLTAAARLYGGTPREWQGAPEDGTFELYTETNVLDIIVPPAFSQRDGSAQAPYSQYFELWAGGGCTRRCDGETELITGRACMCDPEKPTCKITTRASLMLPRVPGLGVWLLESHGWNAATEMTGTLELLRMAAEGNRFITANLRLEQRTKKVPGEGTRRFAVPVIELPDTTIGQLADAVGAPLAINAPAPPAPRPALPPTTSPAPRLMEIPEAAGPAHGAPPPLPPRRSAVEQIVEAVEVVAETVDQPSPFQAPASVTDGERMPTAPMLKKLNVLYGTLPSDCEGRITEEAILTAAWRLGTGDKTDPPEGVGFSDVRDGLTFEQVRNLIDRLEKFSANDRAVREAADPLPTP